MNLMGCYERNSEVCKIRPFLLREGRHASCSQRKVLFESLSAHWWYLSDDCKPLVAVSKPFPAVSGLPGACSLDLVLPVRPWLQIRRMTALWPNLARKTGFANESRKWKVGLPSLCLTILSLYASQQARQQAVSPDVAGCLKMNPIPASCSDYV